MNVREVVPTAPVKLAAHPSRLAAAVFAAVAEEPKELMADWI